MLHEIIQRALVLWWPVLPRPWAGDPHAWLFPLILGGIASNSWHGRGSQVDLFPQTAFLSIPASVRWFSESWFKTLTGKLKKKGAGFSNGMKVASSYSCLVQAKNEEFGLFASVAVSPKGLLAGSWLRMEPGVGGRRPGTAGRASHGARERRGGGGDLSGPGLRQPDAAGPRRSARILRGEMGR